jgi:hypothetical protein
MEFQYAAKSNGEKVYLHVKNDGNEVLEPGKVVSFTNTTTGADQGLLVGLLDTDVNVTSMTQGRQIAGVVHTTIQTNQVGKLQIWGSATVRASTTINASELVVAYSINATNVGHATQVSESTAVGAAYTQLIVGRALRASANATQATIFLKLI